MPSPNADRSSVPATTGDKSSIGPFARDVYDDVEPRRLSFTLSEVTGLDVAVIQIP
jgi:hypothetical protein